MKLYVSLLLVSFGFVAHAKVSTYDKVTTREVLLKYLEHPPATRLEFVGEPANDEARAFLDYFRDHIAPRMEEDSNLEYRYWGVFLLRDSGSQHSQEEFDRWSQTMDDILKEDAIRSVDPKWTTTLREWARLAEGLKGQLPDFARRLSKERDLEAFAPEYEPLLTEINKLSREFNDALRIVPANTGTLEADEGRTQTRFDFKSGKISFDEAVAAQRDRDSRVGNHFVAYEAVQERGENLNRIAVLRTKLAKSKGYPTWAAYRLDQSAGGYTPEFAGIQNQSRWLEDYLRAMRPVLDFYMSSRLKALGLEDRHGEIRLQDLGLISAPGREMLVVNFPKEHITEMWQSTLLESGFRPETLAQLLVDDQFRDKKNKNGAYQASVDGPRNAVDRVDARTLSMLPISKKPGELIPGLAYIMQTYKGKGLEELRTAFHEGGHGTERMLKFKEDPSPEGYGYVEVPSLLSEMFLEDPDLVLKLAVPVDGHKPSRERIVELLGNAKMTDVINMSFGLKSSLFDIKLWDVDYEAPGAPTYLEAVPKIWDEVEALAPLATAFDGPVPYFYQLLSTPHYTSGQVRNIGYDFAAIAARMMADFISDELEKQTGRRNWFEQPGFARIYEEKFVSQGWRKPFPENIEWITGRKFEGQSAVRSFARLIGMPDCAGGLRLASVEDVPKK